MLPLVHTVFLRRFAYRPAAFPAVWGGQSILQVGVVGVYLNDGALLVEVDSRQQELIEGFDELSENQKRLAIRREMIEHNKSLAEAAQMAGVEQRKDFAIFQNYGYKRHRRDHARRSPHP